MLQHPEVLDEDAVPENLLVIHRREQLHRLLEVLRPIGAWPADLTNLARRALPQPLLTKRLVGTAVTVQKTVILRRHRDGLLL